MADIEVRVAADGEERVPVEEASALRICADDEEEVHYAKGDGKEAVDDAQPSKAGSGLLGSKRKRPAQKGGVSMEVLAAKIKRLQDEADAAEAVVKEMEMTIGAKRDEAKAKRQEAQKAASVFVKKQCEVALENLDAFVPKRVMNPYFLFGAEARTSIEYTGLASSEINKRISQKWAGLSDEGKKEYKDKFDLEKKRWLEWGSSEEGKKVLEERNEIIRQCKASQEEQLVEAMESATDPLSANRMVAEMEARSLETPVKKARASVAPQEIHVGLDDKVAEEAEKADLLAQLKNLASRADVQALKKSSQELWDVLRVHNGMVNAAKRALLG